MSPKVSNVLPKHNSILSRLYKLEKLLDGFEILRCDGGLSYLSTKTIFTQNKFTTSEL